MQHYIRVCAEINLDAVAYNFHNMKENLHPDTRIIAVVKTDGYGHGAIPIARKNIHISGDLRLRQWKRQSYFVLPGL